MRKLLLPVFLLCLLACNTSEEDRSSTTSKKDVQIFQKLNNNSIGIDFSNTLKEEVTTKENLLDFDYFYNGAGVGVGDINNDGLVDLFFAGNQVDNKLYLNKGNLTFEDISDKAGININKHWSNGVSFADVNQDGWLDIYVSQGGPKDERANLLYINQQDLTFQESAQTYGLADRGISTQSAFFDYDKDGDLDAIVMNETPLYGVDPLNFYKIIGTREELLHPSCSHLYENQDGKFIDVTEQAGLLKPSFGLGLAVSDLNEDGWLDIYIANDYYLPDALYINQRNGSFSDEVKNKTQQISFYGMGVDIADVNNDGHQDIFVLDMASQDHYRAKTLMASMSTENFDMLTKRFRFPYQYMFNTLQLNTGNQQYKNVAHYAGLAKTDWSWAGLMEDFNNDGIKEIFVTNGYRKYALDNDFKKMVDDAREMYNGAIPIAVKRKLYEQMPTEKLANLLYENQGNLQFKDKADTWGLGQPSYSNGAAYADLDMDGDLELIVNNIDEQAFVYKNLSIEKGLGNYLKIAATDFAKVTIQYDGKIQMSEAKTVRGYLSSVDNLIHFGVGSTEIIDTLIIDWLDGEQTIKYEVAVNQVLEGKNLIKERRSSEDRRSLVQQINQVSIGKLKLTYRHKENIFDDFKKEILLPYKQSTLGPCISKGDINGDGLEDIFIGGASGQAAQLFLNEGQQFRKIENTFWQADAIYEDMEALFFDYEQDGDQDIYVVSGGNAFEPNSENYQDRLYLNNGQGKFSSANLTLLNNQHFSGKTICGIDYDQDGDTDLIVGNRIIPQNYPNAAPSLILQNEGGALKEVTSSIAPDLSNFGIINKIIATDFNNDGWQDFIAVGEWTAIGIFKNNRGTFENISATSNLDQEKGWWFTVGETDINNDGLKDYLVGNVGLNTKFKASTKKPFKVFANDFDNNGTTDIVLSNPYKDKYVPVRGRECSSQQMPFIAEKFPTYDAFANASMEDIYGSKLDSAVAYEATTFNSILLLNEGNGNFIKVTLPAATQTAPTLSVVFHDVNQDGFEDAILAGTIYHTEVETPRWDGGTGLVLFSNQKDGYTIPTENSYIYISGDVKDLETVQLANQTILIAGRNDNLLAVYELPRWLSPAQ